MLVRRQQNIEETRGAHLVVPLAEEEALSAGILAITAGRRSENFRNTPYEIVQPAELQDEQKGVLLDAGTKGIGGVREMSESVYLAADEIISTPRW